MRLDCQETDGGKWHVIDYDNSAEEIAIGDSVEEVWYLAAMELEKIINSVISVLPDK